MPVRTATVLASQAQKKGGEPKLAALPASV
jgi:hypothetical protein